jgi:glycerol-3-phosphate cytidylyltransferase
MPLNIIKKSIKRKKIIGYTTGVFDMFHIGHLNILKKAKSRCDKLIVGITTDKLAEKLKGKKPIFPFKERAEIVKNIKYVDLVVPQKTIDELGDQKKYKFDIIFKGDDWKNTEKWNKLETKFMKKNVKVFYFPYTKHISSTALKEKLENFFKD